MPKLQFSKRVLEALEPGISVLTYRDTAVHGLVLLVHPSGRKTYQVYKKHFGKPVRVTLGVFPEMAPDRARREAQRVLGLLAQGVNPNQQAFGTEPMQETLEQAFEAYLALRPGLKPRTVESYRIALRGQLAPFRNRRLASVTAAEVLANHQMQSERSPARANVATLLLGAIYRAAHARHRDAEGRSPFKTNPVAQVREAGAWHRVKRRRTVLRALDLPVWWDAVCRLDTDPPVTEYLKLIRVHLQVLLFTGLRPAEVLNLAWELPADPNPKSWPNLSGVYDVRDASIRLLDPKNRQERVVPLSTYAADALADLERVGPWLFQVQGAQKPVTNSAVRQRIQERVAPRLGKPFIPSDLRRTFLTVGDELNISPFALRGLVGHAGGDSRDVTAGYVVGSAGRLRTAAQQIGDAIAHAIGLDQRQEASMLVVTRKEGEAVWINDNVRVVVVAVNGNQVKIGFDAPAEVEILREELKKKD